ncbi:ESX secretion-associated protein EspG [Mycobacterium shimoidei]|uniref:ESX-5 secretion-associated protein EspG5 n=1 Tax=Mycobacterium shimoidei TaxID=29313 RepID=A0A1E3TM29_MYCSH|nr:ESX secretion-associated protein EspG [Mycobacterium shimoidei]MCV7258865.1 ESX secretion-associated protein EspG [Mycobacterium shimoidei]ODR15518.1 secretion protein EspG [Mycobacterium shimoidei]ORW80056.1 secretion protein EspG [Mycobacterium shimoidei]SRX92923.1 ESX-5 secretion-associated protein EspG5 [Mycobacterium shimoidei]
MLTTTLDGLWVLQVLTGIEVVAPELSLRPHLPSVEPKQVALTHPVIVELRAWGVVNESGDVDATVLEWLTVLSRRDVAVLVHLSRPGQAATRRALLARYATWWVVIERAGELIHLHGAGIAAAEGPANVVIATEIERLCGSRPAAPLRPVTLDASAVRAAAASPQALRALLARHRLETDQRRILRWVADEQRAAQAAIVAIQYGAATDRPARAHIDQGAVTIIDTEEGRLVVEQLTYAGRVWLVVGPGTNNAIASAVAGMLRRLPAGQEWYAHRKAV